MAPFIFVCAQQATTPQEPASEQVFKNIQVFKGVPANDLIPSMEFMAASLKIECTGCHDGQDYAKDTQTKGVARKMILMQRDINAKNFNNRNQVTCNTCHGGKENPAGTPFPTGVSLRHERLNPAPNTADLFAKHIASAGTQDGPIVRTGTLTAPNDATHKIETLPLEFIQAPGGKFRMVAGERKVMSNGTQTTYGTYPMAGEPAFVFNRIGRTWYGADTFATLERPTVSGKDTIGKAQVVVVRATSPTTSSTQELSFDTKSNLLIRMVNVRRSSLGNVVSSIDYSNCRKVGGMQVPMKVVVTFAGDEQWIMDFKTAKIDPSIAGSTFGG